MTEIRVTLEGGPRLNGQLLRGLLDAAVTGIDVVKVEVPCSMCDGRGYNLEPGLDKCAMCDNGWKEAS